MYILYNPFLILDFYVTDTTNTYKIKNKEEYTKEEQMVKKKHSEFSKGITLISLIITIILLLILAGVVIQLTLGDKGILIISKNSHRTIWMILKMTSKMILTMSFSMMKKILTKRLKKKNMKKHK